MTKSESTVGSGEPDKPKSYFLPALLFLLVFTTGCEAPQPPSASMPRNLVIIGIDTVRADVFYSELIDDALSLRLDGAQQYLNASSVAPWTVPAVASILTGLYPVQHNAGQFQHQPANLDVELPSSLEESAQTLADMLNEHQFRTGAFSAHYWFTAKFGLAQGFEQLHSLKGWEKVTEKFYQWLDVPEQTPQRFFAYLHLMEAHDWHQEKRDARKLRLASVDPPTRALLLEDAQKAACINENSNVCLSNQVYNLAVREVRVAIADVLQKLEDRDVLKDTLVLVYSDHGEEFWEHREEHQQQLDPRGIYGYGHGQSLFQELLHVPLLLWHPKISGAARQDLVSLVDVLPSVLSWLGVPQPDTPLPGTPLPAGTDPVRSHEDPRTVYASGIAYGPEAIATREGQFKSIMRYPGEGFEYYDLSRDPDEKYPLKSNNLTMRFDVLTGDYIDMTIQSLVSSPELDAQTLEHLKSIGYLQGVEEQSEREAENVALQQADDSANKPDSEDSPES